ncbi:MAG: hypothetical protein VX026_09090, partial [Myxococcota bacterium]|nr:hypothetical protein [Myxococcota bacterium]
AGYVIEGTLQGFDNDVRVNVKLLDTETMSIVWSNTYERNLEGADIFAIQDEIVGEITDTLVGNGFIMAEDVQKKAQKKSAVNLSVYECRNFAYHFYKTYLPADYEKVNTCLRESIVTDPDYAELYFHLAHINFVAWQMGYKADEGLITEAIAFADKSIALDPQSAKGYFGKGLLSFVIEDWEVMHHFLQKAVDMAPNNVEILSNAGLLAITGGNCTLNELRDRDGDQSSYNTGDCRWKPGMEMLLKAFEIDKGNLYPVKNYGIAHVYNYWGEYEKAYDQMQLAVSPGMIWYEMHSAISAAGMNDEKLATKHFDAVKKILGSNRIEDAKAHFDRWHIDQYWEMSKAFLQAYGFE